MGRIVDGARFGLDLAAAWANRGQERLGDLERLARFAKGRLEFRPRPEDVWVATYPRSGTTWMLFLLHHLVGPGGDDFEHFDDVSPWFERSLAVGSARAADFDALPSPRRFKTHLLPRWVPHPGRVIHVERDGLDVALSYHELYRRYLGFTAGFDAFFDRFVRGDVQYGSWFSHREAWRRAAESRDILHVRYEALREDPVAELRRVATFLSIDASDARLRDVAQRASLARMKERQARFDHATTLLRERGVVPGHFVRAGLVGEGQRQIAPEQRARFEHEEARGRRRRAGLAAFLH